jgi:hypothetical protein
MDVLVLQVAAGLEKDGHNTWGWWDGGGLSQRSFMADN